MNNRILLRLAAEENTSQANNQQQSINEINNLLLRVKEASNNLKDIYYALFDNLTALYQTYPSVYQQLQKIVKLPSNQDAINITTFNNDLTQALERFKDINYLKSFIQNSSETL